MDSRSFDALTRSLAAPKTRRGVLGGLLALIAGARVAGSQVTQAQCGNVVCGSNPGVCKPGCVCCTFANGNSRCMPPGSCTGTVATTTTTTTTTTPAPTTTTTLGPTTTTTTTTTPAPTTTTTTVAPLLGLGAICETTDQCAQTGGPTFCDDNFCGGDGLLNCCRPIGGSCSLQCDCCNVGACVSNVCSL